ncbi:glycoside hydrolase domain-containing protein [Gemmatimonadota bacterium]
MNLYLRAWPVYLSALCVFIGVHLFVSWLSVDDITYTTGEWNAAEYGNHRAIVHVDAEADAVRVQIPWRRRDRDPEKKNIIIVDSTTGNRIDNLIRVDINREFGSLVFQPQIAPGDYHVYYLPHESSGGSYPRVTYPEPESSASQEWIQSQDLSPASIAGERLYELPRAETIGFQAINDLHSFWPMEVIATGDETERLHSMHPSLTYLVFPEDRTLSIRMTDDLPQRWIESGPATPFRGTAMRGEYYVFQLGIYAMRQPIEELHLEFGALEARGRDDFIPASAFTCFNLGGIDWAGLDFTRDVSVAEGKVQALWCGVQVYEGIRPAMYTGEVTLSGAGVESQTIEIRLRVTDEVIEAAGDNDPWRLSRLRWLNSTIAEDDEIVAPYTPVEVERDELRVLGRRVSLDQKSGLPECITSFFSPEMTHLTDTGRDLLSAPVELVVEDARGRMMPWDGTTVTREFPTPGRAVWRYTQERGALQIDLQGSLEFDGTMEYRIAVTADEEVSLSDIQLRIPLVADVAKYMMGLGLKGGLRPDRHEWQWDVEKNQDGAWIGDVNAGLQFSMRDEHYSRPLNTNFYQLKPLVMPTSWANEGKGGMRLAPEGDDTFLITCFSGARTMQAGETLHYDFRLTVTPFRTLDTAKQWSSRFHHRFNPVDTVDSMGGTVINVHHATEINPYINYPFLRPDEMKAYVDEAHEKGLKVKIYYTVRELANRAPELFALRSLGDEILSYGPGGGHSWLQEHFGENYIGGWFVPRYEDVAVVNSGVSRWHNFYLEGLDWLVRNVGIDGLYIDDVAFDRTVMKRVRKILDRGNPGSLIDLHSANQYNPRDGFANSANLYLEHFAFIDRLWFGEYFDYDSDPDFWMVEVSGIPFGLMGEMLQGGGNPWRGMLWGMTNRQPYGGNNPAPIWQAWDDFGISESRMVGYWVPDTPVTTDHREVLATTWIADGRAMVSIASWADRPVDVSLDIDWEALGLDPGRTRVSAPAIDGFQEAAVFAHSGTIPVEPGRGWLLILDQR